MTASMERFTVETLLQPDLGARVMQPRLRDVEAHWHDYYELCLVLDGEAEHVVNGEVATIGPGSAFLLSPVDVHAIRALGTLPLRCYNAVIDPDLVERQLAVLDVADLPGFPWLVDDLSHAEPDFARLRREFDEPRLGSARVIESLAACLVVEIARRCGSRTPARPRPPGADAEIRLAVAFVDRHFREPLTLADAASAAHLSPNYFSERFRQVVGTSFQSYLQQRRLRFARSLLLSTSLPVTQVCHAAGFNSLSYFGRAYRRVYGAPPSSRAGGASADRRDLTRV